jgi:hypothetical protein
VLARTAVAAALVSAGVFSYVSPAMAATQSPKPTVKTAATVTASGVSPASCNAVGQIWENGGAVTFCGTGFYYQPSGGWTVTSIVQYNSDRWWFHQYSNNTGWAYCIQGRTSGAGIPTAYQHPGNIQVSTNTAAC